MKYDQVVLIGRFQPLHRAHVEIIRRAYELGHQVVILIGSSNLPRTYKNPWTFSERADMIRKEIEVLGLSITRFQIMPIVDVFDDQAWAAQVQGLMTRNDDHWPQVRSRAIIGHSKDESSYYLRMFPQWEQVEVERLEYLNASDIRDIYFKRNVNLSYLSTVVPKATWNFLKSFSETEEFQQIIREREHIENYKLQYRHLPYEPVFVTVDNVIFQSGHVLMVKRKHEPGKGLWALPGGFLNAGTDKSLEDAAIRELKEETKIKVPVPVLKGSIRGNRVFDAINRSARGRTITHAFHIVLPDGELPKVRGADDAEVARWVPISEVSSDECFEDHYQIIQYFLGS